MKKLCVPAILAFLLICLSACTGAGAIWYPERDIVGKSSARQFGQTDAVVLSQSDFTYVVLYPKTGIDALDGELCVWAEKTVDDAVMRRTMSDDGRLGGELMVGYDSYLVDSRFVSIAHMGSYVSRGTAPPFEIAHTLTYDLLENRVVEPIELIPFTSHPQMFAIIEKKLLEHEPSLDTSSLTINSAWLEPIVLTPEDIRLIISGDSNPLAEMGVNELVFSYEELEGILFLPGEQIVTMQQPPEHIVAEIEVVSTQPDEIDLTGPMIALSFDDGPSAVTASLLDLLERYNVPATFFMIGRQVPEYADTVKRMADLGCELASHTWDHPELNRLSRDAIAEQIEMTADAIEAAAGIRPRLLRPPYGAANAAVREITAELGAYLVNWSVDTQDWKSRNAQSVYEHIMANAREGRIILCHDLYQSTIDAMEMAIPALLEQGYQIVTVGKLLGLEEDQMVLGTVYRQK